MTGEVLGTLTQEQYIRWKNNLLEFLNKHLEYRLVQKTQALMEKELELNSLKKDFHKNQVKQKGMEYDVSKEAYEKLLKELEEEIGFSMKGVAVNEITYEVFSAESAENNK